MMNVLVWNSWVTSAGGMERVALSLASGLAELPDVSVTLVGPFDKVPVLLQRIDGRVNFVPCEFKRHPAALTSNALLLRRLVRELRIDVVSAHGSLLPLLPVGVPVLWTEHGPRYGDEPIFKGLRTLSWKLIQRKLRSNQWKLVGCSEYVCNRLCPQFGLPLERASVILNGIPNAERFTKLLPPAFNRPYSIGFMGRLEPEKHPDDIFTLSKLVEKRGLPCEWHIFGDGSMAETLRNRAEGHPRIRCRGLAADPAQAFAEMDAFVFLSHGQMEGLPTVMIESQLAHRPVIAWDVTANPEAAGPADQLVMPFDLKLFADAIVKVCKASIPAPVPDKFRFDRMVKTYHAELAGHAEQKNIVRHNDKGTA